MKLPYGYSLITNEEDPNYPLTDVSSFVSDPYPTVADNLAAMPGYQLAPRSTIYLPAPQPLSILPVIPKSSPPPAPSMIYYQVTTSPGKQITPMPITATFSVGDDIPAAGLQPAFTLSQLLIFGVIFYLLWR